VWYKAISIAGEEVVGPLPMPPVNLVHADRFDPAQLAMGQTPLHGPIHRFPTGLKDRRRLSPAQTPHPAGKKSHHRRRQWPLAVTPGNVFHHDLRAPSTPPAAARNGSSPVRGATPSWTKNGSISGDETNRLLIEETRVCAFRSGKAANHLRWFAKLLNINQGSNRFARNIKMRLPWNQHLSAPFPLDRPSNSGRYFRIKRNGIVTGIDISRVYLCDAGRLQPAIRRATIGWRSSCFLRVRRHVL
jgi:hypothetical protein